MGKTAMKPGGLWLLLRVLLLWAASALLLLTVASLVLSRAHAGSGVLGYCSSAISFLSAAAAVFFAADHGRDRLLLRGLLPALFLVIVLLTLGFLARGKDMSPSGILSVSCFTFAGALLGGALPPKGRGRRRTKGKRLRRIS